ncbi:polysaccharide biosynthesis protein [Halobacillus sp. ACCC02827]|uniref:putative polysaccharide biosynthesis protein n=1 Tax=Halobacillus sp. ACCC02827 TaxID=3052090 RepID=UPI002570E6B7|nr:polysaccharide biosynthesis protein [Halobacillus sp. ACCC02827]WJE15891.1 polysaccharide biosynthesis protein [Halobacillus sp. ACCC02827]
MTHTRSNSFLKGAFILTLAGLISKVISAGYRIPLQNLTGDIGFYIYQQVYPILGVALLLGLYGFPAAISVLVAEKGERPLSIPSFYLPVFGYMSGLCLLIFSAGYLMASDLASVMGDTRLVSALRASFAVFLLVPFAAIFRGVFQGRGNMGPTAISQITEQLLRVGLILAAAISVMRGGEVYRIGLGAAAGSMLGAFGAAVLLYVWFRKTPSFWTWERSSVDPKMGRRILLNGIFICLNYMLLISLQLIDAFTMIPGLMDNGFSVREAREAKGVFDRGQPLVQLGTVLASSLALAVLPSINRKRWEKEKSAVERDAFRAVKFTLIIAAGAAVGLMYLFRDINISFFRDEAGTGPLRVFMFVIIFSSLIITLSSILQGLGYMRQTAGILVIGVVVKTLGNLVWIPAFGVYGTAVSSIIAVAFVLVGNIVLLRQEIPWRKWFALPWRAVFVSASGMVVGLWIIDAVLPYVNISGSRIWLLLFVLVRVGVGAALYLLLLLKCGCFTRVEVAALPARRWLMKLLPKGMKE